MLLIGSVAPWVFAGIAALNTVAVIMLLAPSANLRLEQQARDTGSVAALIKFSATLLGAIGIQRVSAHAGNLSRAVVFYGPRRNHLRRPLAVCQIQTLRRKLCNPSVLTLKKRAHPFRFAALNTEQSEIKYEPSQYKPAPRHPRSPLASLGQCQMAAVLISEACLGSGAVTKV